MVNEAQHEGVGVGYEGDSPCSFNAAWFWDWASIDALYGCGDDPGGEDQG